MPRWKEYIISGFIAICGLVPLALGLRWLQLFIFTDYRAHHRHIMIPLGLTAATIGLAIVLTPLWYWLMTPAGERSRDGDTR